MLKNLNLLLQNYLEGDVTIIEYKNKKEYRGTIQYVLIQKNSLTMKFKNMIELCNDTWTPSNKLNFNLTLTDPEFLLKDTVIIKSFDYYIEFNRKPAVSLHDITNHDTRTVNINEPVLEIPHMELQRVFGSEYASICPVCERGLLLFKRDTKSSQLLEDDMCTLCGQRIKYIDVNYLRKKESGK